MSTSKKNSKIKSVKKASSVWACKPLTAKNAKDFANMIYSDRGGVVTFTKLCDATLSDGKDGGRTLHCAIGEAVFTFVKKDVASFEKRFAFGAATEKAIDELIKVASLKKRDDSNEDKLRSALNDCVEVNDEAPGEDGVGKFSERAKDVADIWLKTVVPLLK